MLRNVRWIAAGLLTLGGLIALPGRAAADTMILVEELNGSTVVNSQTFSVASLPTSGSPYSPAGGAFTGISLTVTSTSGVSSNVNSLTTTVAAKPSASFDPSHSLRVTVTDDGFLNASAGSPADVTNDPGASSGISGGVNNLSGTTTIQSGTILSGLTTLGATPASSDTSPGGPSDGNTTVNIPSLPSTFAMTQEITIHAIPTTGIDPNSTFGGTLSSTIVTTPPQSVPAPAGLLLALTALPVLGFRRVLRRKAA
jgi:hypothetical protein